MILVNDLADYFISHRLIVGMRALVAAFDHFHPPLAIGNEPLVEGFANGIARTGDRLVSLECEVVLHDIPGKFMGKLEGLDETLLFEIGQGTLSRENYRFGQLCESRGIIGQTLLPANIPSFHDFHLPRQAPRKGPFTNSKCGPQANSKLFRPAVWVKTQNSKLKTQNQ